MKKIRNKLQLFSAGIGIITIFSTLSSLTASADTLADYCSENPYSAACYEGGLGDGDQEVGIGGETGGGGLPSCSGTWSRTLTAWDETWGDPPQTKHVSNFYVQCSVAKNGCYPAYTVYCYSWGSSTTVACELTWSRPC